MSKVTIYYGMSGSLKLQTINQLHKEDLKVLSPAKKVFQYDEDYFNWSGRPNNSHLVIFRLLQLDLDNYLSSDRDVAIERGITDYIYYLPKRNIPNLESYDKIRIKELVDMELEILKRRTGADHVEKILLKMTDRDFIAEKSLAGPDGRYRADLYKDTDRYLEEQCNYIQFTLTYNKIDSVELIKDAKDYIENKLHLEYR